MAIYGIGTDLVEVARIETSMSRHGGRFRDRIFTPKEIAYCDSLYSAAKFRSYAARFAAKEALSKAFHLGIGPGFDWIDLEITRNDAGAPSVILHGRAATLSAKEALGSIHISLSHTNTHALAYAIIEN